ncbi:MAG: ABC transporter substrate-binding protein, partial [Tardiphaga sp.]
PLYRQKFGKNTEGVMGIGGWSGDSAPIKDYLARHKAASPNGAEPDRWASAVTYASLQMLQQAIERVGKVDRAAVIKDLQTGSFDTVIGKVKLENNLPTRYWWVGQWQDGDFYGVGPAANEGARAPVVPKPAWKAP